MKKNEKTFIPYKAGNDVHPKMYFRITIKATVDEYEDLMGYIENINAVSVFNEEVENTKEV